jgi:hypothetical protein
MKTRKSGRISLSVLTYALDLDELSACFNPERETSTRCVVLRAYVNLLLPVTNRILIPTARKLLITPNESVEEFLTVSGHPKKEAERYSET